MRITPALPAHLRQTFGIQQAPETHTRPATCVEVECEHHARGWQLLVDESTDLGVRQGQYLRGMSGRAFTEDRTEDGLTRFTFAAEQDCFRQHRVPLDRPAVFLVVGGDHRGNPRGERLVHTGPEPWVDHLHTHLDTLAAAAE